jgi:hypothetical protein
MRACVRAMAPPNAPALPPAVPQPDLVPAPSPRGPGALQRQQQPERHAHSQRATCAAITTVPQPHQVLALSHEDTVPSSANSSLSAAPRASAPPVLLSLSLSPSHLRNIYASSRCCLPLRESPPHCGSRLRVVACMRVEVGLRSCIHSL